MRHEDNFSITKTTKGKLPRLPFQRMKEAILGKRYELSLVFIGAKRARTLNRMYRKKAYVPNVLSFPLSETSGEIFLCLEEARREARENRIHERRHISHLFIHALLHLKGMRHGATMERKENDLLQKFV